MLFGGLGQKGHPGGSSAKNIFEGSLTEEVTGEGKDILEGGLKFSAYEAMKKFDITASEDRGEISYR